MKTTFTTLAAVLVTLCFTSTALAETPAPAPGNAQKNAGSGIPQFYYSEMSSMVIAPQITKAPKDAKVNEGQNIKFTIEFRGIPSPTVVVLFNGRYINFAEQMPNKEIRYDVTCTDSYCAFSIRSVEPQHAGDYSFRVVNTGGTVTATVKLTVL